MPWKSRRPPSMSALFCAPTRAGVAPTATAIAPVHNHRFVICIAPALSLFTLSLFTLSLFHVVERRNVLSHRHDGRARQLLDERVAFHLIRVRAAAEENPDVGALESQRRDQKRAEGFGASVIEVADHVRGHG